jgi:hypothetical protein
MVAIPVWREVSYLSTPGYDCGGRAEAERPHDSAVILAARAAAILDFIGGMRGAFEEETQRQMTAWFVQQPNPTLAEAREAPQPSRRFAPLDASLGIYAEAGPAPKNSRSMPAGEIPRQIVNNARNL